MSPLAQRIVGVVSILPLAGMIAVIVPTCKRGTVQGAAGVGLGSEWLNNLAMLGLFLSAALAVVGVWLLFRRSDNSRGSITTRIQRPPNGRSR